MHGRAHVIVVFEFVLSEMMVNAELPRTSLATVSLALVWAKPLNVTFWRRLIARGAPALENVQLSVLHA